MKLSKLIFLFLESEEDSTESENDFAPPRACTCAAARVFAPAKTPVPAEEAGSSPSISGPDYLKSRLGPRKN